MDGRESLEARAQQDSGDAEIARLRREVETLRERERAARADAADARKHFSELTAMSRRFASSMRGRASERQQYRRRLAAQYAVSRVLAEARDLQQAAPLVFEILGERLGWHLGILWTLDWQAGVLRRAGIWRSSGTTPGFMEKACENMRLRPGESLPGRVWEREEPVWVEDVLEDGDFLRNGAAAEDGMRGAFAFPIRNGGFRGVFEFFRHEVLPPDEDLLRTAGLIGDQIGQFLERRRAEKERDELLIREQAARAEAEESRERMREVLESIGDAFFALDRRWHLTYVNDRAVDLTGRSREELLGKSVLEALPELVEGVVSADLIRAEEEGSATEFEHYSSKLDRWLYHRVYPSPDGLSVYTIDITGRKKAEQKLRAREEEYRTTFELAGVGKAQADLQTGRLLRVNRRLCEITGYEPEELLARTFTEITHPEDQDREYDGFRRMVRGEIDEYETEKRYVRKDGGAVWVRVNATAIRDPEGRPLRTIATIEDTTKRKRAEEELKSSEELYRLIADNSTDMISKHTPEGVYAYVSPACRSLLGYEPEELIGCSAYEFFHPKDLEAIKRAHASILELPDTYTVSYRTRRKDGSYIWFETSSRTIRDPQTGAVQEIIATSRDITERKRTEEALRKSEERYKTLYEDNPFMYFTVDARGTVLSVNHSGAQQLGSTVEELVGRPVLDLFHEEDREGVSRYLSLCLQDLERPSSWEARKLRKDGSIMWARESLRIVEGPDGAKIGLLICEDITERKQAEEQILLQAQLLEQVQAAVISTDLQGTITYWNEYAEELYGWLRKEALGRNIMELIIGPNEAEVAKEIMERLWSGETWAGEFVVRRKDGSVFPAHVSDSLIYDTQGHAVGVVGVSTDITERKKAEEERGRLLAHEGRARAEAEERKRISRELHDRVAHSMGVVHQSLELYDALKARDPEAASRRLTLARETTKEALQSTRDLSLTLRNEVDDGLASALSHLLSTAVPPDVQAEVSVQGDSSLIPRSVQDQLFLSLREGVRNTVSHSGAGTVKVDVEITPEEVRGTVEDDGRGFDPREVRSDESGGLKSMRERAALVGGILDLESVPGGGTRIEVIVPLLERG